MNLLETKGLDFSYKSQQILNQVHLKIPEGSIYGYLGKNGSGKTTTIKILLGLVPVPKNTVFFQQKEFNTNRLEILHNTGNLIESPSFYGGLTALENLKYLDIIYKCGKSRVQHVLDLVGLKKDQQKKVKFFSTGMKQRLGIAMAMLHDPNLLVLDEPLNGLDPEGVYEMRELMLKLKNEGKTIFLSSHILGEIEKSCTHIGILDNKNLVFQGEIKALLTNRKREILIKTNDLESSLQFCLARSISAFITSDNLLSVNVEDDDDHHELLQLLIQNRMKLFSVNSKENNLEFAYLNLTTSK